MASTSDKDGYTKSKERGVNGISEWIHHEQRRGMEFAYHGSYSANSPTLIAVQGPAREDLEAPRV
jgi:hypothetical protein